MSPFVMNLSALPMLAVAGTATSTSGDDNTTHPTPSLPASTSAGDVLVVAVRIVGERTQTTPSGWTLLAAPTTEMTENGPLFLYARTADGSEGATVSVTLSDSARWVANAYRFVGAHGDVEGGMAYHDFYAPDPPSLTPAWGSAENFWLAIGSTRRTNQTLAAPTNYTDFIEVVTIAASTSTLHAHMGSARRKLTGTAEDPGAMGSGTGFNRVISATVAVRPA